MKASRNSRRHCGFTMMELSVVSIVLIVIIALAIPAVRSMVIQGRVTSSGKDLARAVLQLKSRTALTASTTPYSPLPDVDRLLQESNFRVNTATNTVLHDLGAPNGAITFTSIASGAALAITVWGIHPAACPGLANTMAKAADVIEIGQGGTAATPGAPAVATVVPAALNASVVKISGGDYNAVAAAAACSPAGEHNFMRFYINA